MKSKISETEIKLAIQEQNYVLYYQPKFENKSRKIIGAEALMRLKVNDELLLPDAFLHIVLAIGEMERMQIFLFHEVVRALNSPELVNLDFSISVNMNSSELVSKNHIKRILNLLKFDLIHPENLEIEITERSEFPDFTVALGNLAEMKELGIKISLDDFGRGFNSLSYLYILPIDIMKLDRLFINKILTDLKVQVIVDGVIQMAHKLGIRVVAEGVETLEQVEYMDGLNCDIYQGFYFAKPVSFGEIKEKWLSFTV
ncbi:EAL domain-containing protein [Carnobacterium gallinarum]|uniref:EAL domain-containing protein n=1 Tax=Carnobacterium gallinarum TaxID=2749 RepID=UPI000ACFC063|nr:EAL domain-containing protein [Carnobacterium gallinarum]